jgi:hypothetical protein
VNGILRLTLRFVSLLATVAALPAAWSAPPTSQGPTYREVAPILRARCVVCHSKEMAGTPALSGGLALDSYAAIQAATRGPHPLFTAGKSGQSELVRRLLATSPTLLMPKGGPPLPPEQIALVRRWIDVGAPEGRPLGAETAKAVDPAAIPLPTLPGTQNVILATRIAPSPDLKRKGMPDSATLALALKIGPLPPVNALAFSPDGKRLAIGGYRAVTFWEVATGRPIACLSGLAGPVQSLAFRPDGTQIAVAAVAPGMPGEVRVYDAATLAPVAPALSGHTDQVFCVAWSSDGKRLATACQDKAARLWEWPSGKLLFTFKDHGDGVTRVCFAPDGKSLYTACMDHSLRRYDCAKGTLIHAYSGHEDAVTALAINPSGTALVSGGPEKELRWWNIDPGDNTSRQGGHSDTVTDLVFAKDGKLLVSASADHTVRLWDGGNGAQQRALDGATDWIYAAAFSPDDKMVAGAGADGVTRLWEAASGRLRLLLLAWPPVPKATAPDWLALTPEGYYDGSPAWVARLHPQLADTDLTAPRLVGFVHSLQNPDNVTKAWKAAALDPAAIPAPTVAPKPAPDAKKPVVAKTNKEP